VPHLHDHNAQVVRIFESVADQSTSFFEYGKYDFLGRRIQKSGPLGTTNFLYDELFNRMLKHDVYTFSNSMRAEYGYCRRSSRMTFLISTSTYGRVLSLM
jgi:hypothetical protein